MSTKKNLLIIGASDQQIYAYQVAKQMNLNVIATDINPNAPAVEFADYFIEASTRDVDATILAVNKFHRKETIHGVMTLANDVPLTVASVAENLGLPGLSVQSASIISNKIKMKECFLEHDIPTAPFKLISNAKEALLFAKEHGYPVILKPLDGRGARGVLRITDSTDKEWLERAFSYSTHDCILAEKFIQGKQLSTESMLYNGKCYTASVSERNYELMDVYDPFVIENGGIIPANLSQDVLNSIDEVLSSAARALNYKEGTIKGDLVIGPNGLEIIEVALRLSGGFLCTDQIPITRGVDLVKQTIKLALGQELAEEDIQPRDLCKMGIRYFFPEPGVVTEINGFEELSNFNWITKKELFVNVGDIIESPEHHVQRVGFIHAVGRTFEEAEERVLLAHDSVEIKTIPLDEAN